MAKIHLNDWLLTEARFTTDPGELLLKICKKLDEKGFGLLRCMLGIRTLHPEVSVELYIWQRDQRYVETPKETIFAERERASDTGGINRISLSHSAFESEAYKKSPLYVVVEKGVWVRCKIEPDQTELEYPILSDLQAIGATDYIAAPLKFTTGPKNTVTWVTDKPGGFSENDMYEFESLMPVISVCFEIFSLRHTTTSLVRTYLGADPGGLVLAGQVKPGDIRRIEAAIWFSDLRGFTQLSSQLEPQELVETLNEYFTVLADVIEEHGGQILKYIGDAMLVIFPVGKEKNASRICQDAVNAALIAESRLLALNIERKQNNLPLLDHGIGLHFGNAEYGNIGAPGRLDFTVIGKDVNLASRVEGLCAKIEQRLLATSEICNHANQVKWLSLDSHELKGISKAVEIFTVDRK